MLRLGLIADTHNHQQHVLRAVEHFRAEGISTVLHAGDVTGLEVLELLTPFELWVAWGNVDRDERLPGRVALVGTPGTVHGAYVHSLTFDGRKLALVHGDNVPQLTYLIESGEYDYVIHGHTHRLRDERSGRTRVLNPGALGGSGLPPKTFAILEPATGQLQILEV